MSRTACTEPQCLYNSVLHLLGEFCDICGLEFDSSSFVHIIDVFQKVFDLLF